MDKKYILLIIIILNSLTSLAQNSLKIQLANEYYQNGELIKAKDLYEELAKSTHNIRDIHTNYLSIFIKQEDYKSAEKYLKRIQRYSQTMSFIKLIKL